MGLLLRLEQARNLPSKRFGATGHVFGTGASHPATWGEERHRLKNVGFARAVGAIDRNRQRPEGNAGQFVRAEMGKRQLGKGERGH